MHNLVGDWDYNYMIIWTEKGNGEKNGVYVYHIQEKNIEYQTT